MLKQSIYPQKVEVVNQTGTSENPLKSEVVNLPLVESGGTTSVSVRFGGGVIVSSVRPQNTYFNLYLDNILLLKGDGTFSPIPLNSTFIGMTATNINNMLASYKTAYATLVSGVSAATLHYSKMTSTGAVTSEVYNLKD